MTIHQKIPLWLDCDPGNDDVFAILLAIFSPRFQLLGISTVHGNASVKATTKNALGLLDVLKVDDVKVYQGLEKPLVNAPKYAAHVHGKTGVGGAVLPENPTVQESTDMSYLDAMKKAILDHENEIVVACTGTMTNLSKLISQYPELKAKIRYVAAMGGCIDGGNVTPYAEFNFNADPHAASHVVQELGDKIILAPLNITHTAMALEPVRQRMYQADSELDSPIRKLFYDVVMFFYDKYQIRYGPMAGPPVHDPLALFLVQAFIDDDEKYNFVYERRKMEVIEEGEREGSSVIVEGEGGVYIGKSINVDMFWDSVLQALADAVKHVESRS
ncbi:nucleoside hydrolase [Suhomyces tanzawaensis NRRL Y-17324]|uniref:Nucleoside hydrolase n=1 Tax=Suhomyces tanzawaensis NRRL Y-17324 TaxID=984487 RepID=A0A1E4SR59_9ASCO|nr:nucleoside hydrolase [Suhomyces tanzawaensis NRRL Y-17324]ODV82006.1 nucleoside hydrolase [Suhomyces tanzawaensis NRRL Y-17324]